MSIALEARVAELEKDIRDLKEKVEAVLLDRQVERGEAWPEPRRKPGPKPKDSNG